MDVEIYIDDHDSGYVNQLNLSAHNGQKHTISRPIKKIYFEGNVLTQFKQLDDYNLRHCKYLNLHSSWFYGIETHYL